VEDIAPVIISASRAMDIPAFYPDWWGGEEERDLSAHFNVNWGIYDAHGGIFIKYPSAYSKIRSTPLSGWQKVIINTPNGTVEGIAPVIISAGIGIRLI
jgi:hypothetical protein